MRRIATIIGGFENKDVLKYTVYAPLLFSTAVVFVDGIRPIIKRINPEIKWNEYFKVPYSQDGTKELCKELEVVYMNPNRALYNGEKINIALSYLRSKFIKFDSFLYLEADEVIEPEDVEVFLNEVDTANNLIYSELIKVDEKEIAVSKLKDIKLPMFMSFNLIQLWKNYSGFIVNPSCSKLVNVDLKFSDYDEGHNEGDLTDIAFSNIIPGVRMYHLREFRRNCISRIKDGVWSGGGDSGGRKVEDVCFALERTQMLDSIYSELTIQDRNIDIKDSKNTYVGVIGDECFNRFPTSR